VGISLIFIFASNSSYVRPIIVFVP